MNKFIACGVPRSGTTALASLLNWHPTVFCGIERFPLRTVDRSFFTREMVRDRTIPSGHLERNIKTLDQKGSLDALGDKGPRYFYRLAGSPETFADMKLIFIIRSLPGVFNSWNQRAFNPEDKTWHRGQTGVFAYLDTLQMLYALNRIKDSHEALVLGYEQLFYGEKDLQREIIDQIFEFLGAQASDLVHDQFEAESAKRESLYKRQLKLSSKEMNFIENVQVDSLLDVLDQNGGIASTLDLSQACNSLLDDFYTQHRKVLAALDDLLLPRTGISQAVTIMKFCYEMSGSNNFYSGLNKTIGTANSTFELLANMFNAKQAGRFEKALDAADCLLERYSECPELFIEMSEILDRAGDRRFALECMRRAVALRPENDALSNRLKFLLDKFKGTRSTDASTF